jgi:two-component system, OmpR family, sensor histidine kinase MprB
VSFRARLAVVAAVAVAVAVVVASAVVYVVVRGELRSELDDTLATRAAEISHAPLHVEPGPGGQPTLDLPPGLLASVGGYVQVVRPDGSQLGVLGQRAPLPVDERTLAIAQGRAGSFYEDATVAGRDVRMLTVAEPGGALQLARPLSEVNRTLHRLAILLALIAVGGIGVAAALGLAVSRAALGPVRRLTEATERVTQTGDLSERIEAHGGDEVSRLAGSFNRMLGALEDSTRAQRQLVADASHELRTPLTSLRTNIEVLASQRALPPGERERLLTDVVEQLGEMTTLIAELIELARGEQHPEAAEDVRLDLLAADAVARARRNRPEIVFRTDLEESLVRGVPATIERALANLIDNAAKWSPPGGEVEVSVRRGRISVRDHGPGIAAEDLPYVFDRFYRAPSARGMPGSGLGLAIVRQVAEAHGGSVAAEPAEGGGTRMTIEVNGLAAPPESDGRAA